MISHIIAISHPPPNARPLTAAMIGLIEPINKDGFQTDASCMALCANQIATKRATANYKGTSVYQFEIPYKRFHLTQLN